MSCLKINSSPISLWLSPLSPRSSVSIFPRLSFTRLFLSPSERKNRSVSSPERNASPQLPFPLLEWSNIKPRVPDRGFVFIKDGLNVFILRDCRYRRHNCRDGRHDSRSSFPSGSISFSIRVRRYSPRGNHFSR